MNEKYKNSKVSKYRPEIDGLRAIAIIPVVLFHAGIPGASGGFIGVDVFYVISGYLITTLILGDIDAGDFRFTTFLLRRARRIFPALSVVVLCTLIGGWFVFLPTDFKDLGRSVFAQSIFLSNVYFWLKSGYFTAPAETKPLLHTWSLSIEEQFYLIFPLFLYFIRKYFDRFNLTVLSIGIALSFALCAWNISREPVATFFLLPTRAWELLTGVLIAVGLHDGDYTALTSNVIWTEAASALGLIAIGYAVIAFNQNTLIPGTAALLPCLGAAAIIWANSSRLTLVGQLLSLRPLIWVGLISYSFYLWHWPALVFARYMASARLSSFQSLAVVLLSAVMAYVSYKWIELPIRRHLVLPDNIKFTVTASGALLSMAVCGIAINLMDGAPYRLAPMVLETYADSIQIPASQCKHVAVSPHLHVCSNYDNSHPPDLIIWGDSHSRMLMPALEPILNRSNIRFWHYSCIPVFDVYRVNDSNSLEGSECYLPNQEMKEYLKHNSVEHVLMVSFWSQYTEGREIPMEGAGQHDPFYADAITRSSTAIEAREVFRRHFLQTIDFLRQRDIEVWIMREVPIHLYWVSNQLAKTLKYGGDVNALGRPFFDYAKRTAFIHGVLEQVEDSYTHLLDPAGILCKENFCRATMEGRALYRDFNHLSPYGAVSLLPVFQPMFHALGNISTDHKCFDCTK